MPGESSWHIATVPGTDFVLRWFPYDHATFNGITDTFSAYPDVDCLTTVQRYHDDEMLRLAEAGVPVAGYRAEVRQHNPSIPGIAAIYYTTWFHPGQKLAPLDNRGHHIPPRLEDYYRSLDPDGLFMADVHRPDQYMAGGGAPTELTDMDPRLAPSELAGRARWHPAFQSWLGHAIMARSADDT